MSKPLSKVSNYTYWFSTILLSSQIRGLFPRDVSSPKVGLRLRFCLTASPFYTYVGPLGATLNAIGTRGCVELLCCCTAALLAAFLLLPWGVSSVVHSIGELEGKRGHYCSTRALVHSAASTATCTASAFPHGVFPFFSSQLRCTSCSIPYGVSSSSTTAATLSSYDVIAIIAILRKIHRRNDR